MSKELSPLEIVTYLLEDIPVNAEVLQRELSDEDRRALLRALLRGLEEARSQLAAASSESDLQRAANDLLSLVEDHATLRERLLPADMPDRQQREQWLEHEPEPPDTPPQEVRKNIELLIGQAILALLAGDKEANE